MLEKITLDGVSYVREDTVQKLPVGNRKVVVIDKGWIFAGDVTYYEDRILITNAVWVFKWISIGFSGLLANPEKGDLRKVAYPIDLPKHSEVYSVPVPSTWGDTAK